LLTICNYTPDDSAAVGLLIAETYGQINLSFLPEDQRGPYLGPFQHANSTKREDQQEIANLIQAPIVLVAKEEGKIVGVLRGRSGRLHSLFVDQRHHRRGIGRQLMEVFEDECRKLGAERITLASSLFAVPFYASLGYKKSTGVRKGWSFDGEGFKWQPMKKVL
jgi:GNAT superfamily N-acetyltransferase